MKRFASVTFDGVLAACEREAATRTLGSLGVIATSWSTRLGRTYARATLDANAAPDAAATAVGAGIDAPPLGVWHVVPRFADRLALLAEALGGPGAPVGVRDVRRDATSLVVAFDTSATSLVLALIDVETGSPALRRIEPLVPLDDATLAILAGAVLQEPELDASRLIETHLEPLLADGAR